MAGVVHPAATGVTQCAAQCQPQAAEPHVTAACAGIGQRGAEGFTRRFGDDGTEIETADQGKDALQAGCQPNRHQAEGHQQQAGHQALLQPKTFFTPASQWIQQ
ncbi:hypothetical protein D3C80_1598390 [compost metagenome]